MLGHSTFALHLEAAAIEATVASLGAACRRLDQLYIPTRYPNGLPDNVPHDFYDDGMSAAALGDLDAVVGCVQRFVSVTP